MAGLGSAIGLGITQGIAQAQEYERGREQRDLALNEARMRQEHAQLQLDEYKANAPSRADKLRLELETLQAQSYVANAQTLKSQTYDAFRMFEADKDVRHLNTWLQNAKQNPVGANLYGNVVRIDPLTKSTENDQLLRSMGYQDLEGIYADPTASTDLVVVTGTDQRRIVNMNDMYAGTGFTNYMTNEQLKTAEAKARLQAQLRAGKTVRQVSLQEQVVRSLMQDKGLTMAEAYQELQGGKVQRMTSDEGRAVQAIMEDEGLTYTEALAKYYEIKSAGKVNNISNERAFIENYLQDNPGASEVEASIAYANRAKTSTQKEIVDVEEVKNQLDADGFLAVNMSELAPAERAKYHRSIAKIEDLRNIKLSNEDKRVARDLRNLTQLGGTAGSELTAAETGLVDSTINSLKKYMYDEVGGKNATSAYETFRNIFRNSLYGASVTQGETKSFEAATGNLKQQLKPVLTQLRTQLVSVKTNLESIRDTNDPYLAHYYYGMDIDQVDDVVRALDERIGMVDGKLQKEQGKKADLRVRRIDKTAPPVQDGAPKPSLDDIFGE